MYACSLLGVCSQYGESGVDVAPGLLCTKDQTTTKRRGLQRFHYHLSHRGYKSILRETDMMEDWKTARFRRMTYEPLHFHSSEEWVLKNYVAQASPPPTPPRHHVLP